jgi:phage-related tail protein
VAKPKKEGEDERDAKIEELVKKMEDQAKAIEDLKSENKALKDERDAEKDAEAVEAKIEESLKGKPAHVQEQVRADLEGRDLTEDNVVETVKKAIGRVEVIYETAGIDPAKVPAGKGEVKPEDADENEKKGALTEGQKNQAQRLVEG